VVSSKLVSSIQYHFCRQRRSYPLPKKFQSIFPLSVVFNLPTIWIVVDIQTSLKSKHLRILTGFYVPGISLEISRQLPFLWFLMVAKSKSKTLLVLLARFVGNGNNLSSPFGFGSEITYGFVAALGAFSGGYTSYLRVTAKLGTLDALLFQTHHLGRCKLYTHSLILLPKDRYVQECLFPMKFSLGFGPMPMRLCGSRYIIEMQNTATNYPFFNQRLQNPSAWGLHRALHYFAGYNGSFNGYRKFCSVFALFLCHICLNRFW